VSSSALSLSAHATANNTRSQIQLDLFVPYEYGYDFKVIVTNKRIHARKLLAYHNGRGA